MGDNIVTFNSMSKRFLKKYRLTRINESILVDFIAKEIGYS